MIRLVLLLILIGQSAFAAQFTMLYSDALKLADRITLCPALRQKRVIAGSELEHFKGFVLGRLKKSWDPCLVGYPSEATIPEFRLIIEVDHAGQFSPFLQFSLGPECFIEGETAYNSFIDYTRTILGIENIPDVWGSEPKSDNQ